MVLHETTSSEMMKLDFLMIASFPLKTSVFCKDFTNPPMQKAVLLAVTVLLKDIWLEGSSQTRSPVSSRMVTHIHQTFLM